MLIRDPRVILEAKFGNYHFKKMKSTEYIALGFSCNIKFDSVLQNISYSGIFVEPFKEMSLVIDLQQILYAK